MCSKSWASISKPVWLSPTSTGLSTSGAPTRWPRVGIRTANAGRHSVPGGLSRLGDRFPSEERSVRCRPFLAVNSSDFTTTGTCETTPPRQAGEIITPWSPGWA